ncbi:hypothetical protein K1T71_014698 [Dendrolimus kikuchii]|uniref:Uncharacterized protein n=1 Tax=Dendrolimus kikuchii TaxID=765133 RepID=A0ACC1CF67_9NEOP|nr:hypothetical protein K1T71_014698 [Dendrolimus kikuchii]
MSNSESVMFNPVTYLLEFLAAYGWYVVGLAVLSMYILNKLRPSLDKWKQAREDAEYHKDPDRALARMEEIQRARDKQQRLLLEASQKAIEQQKEREERKRAEALERLEKYGTAAGRKLGSPSDGDFLPLSGGASTSSYRPPKRSACAKGGCGR